MLAMSLKARDAAYAVNPRSSPSLSSNTGIYRLGEPGDVSRIPNVLQAFHARVGSGYTQHAIHILYDCSAC